LGGAETEEGHGDRLQVLGGEDDDGSREHANYRHIDPPHDRPSIATTRAQCKLNVLGEAERRRPVMTLAV
jgi:hypothetical protein